MEPVRFIGAMGSTYIPLDSWMYPALTRLYSLGYLDTAFLGLRPWTRLSVAHMLEESADKIFSSPGSEQAQEIYNALQQELTRDTEGPGQQSTGTVQLDSVYTRLLGISGTPLRDSFHLGQTFVNDYGRPYQEGFNNVTGFSVRAEQGRFSLYFRGEFQHAPSAAGYSTQLADYLSNVVDRTNCASGGGLFPCPPNEATIPRGPIGTANDFRILEANASAHLAGHEVSFGKSDAWFGPAQGGGMAWSNNAENIYSFRINRIEPLDIPLLHRLLGPMRYDFFVGSLKGHTFPNAPWVHGEKFSFKPTPNFEFGFERTVIWGGKGHAPITLHSFLKSFFSISDTTSGEKFSRNDPGARFTAFDFSYRLPFVRRYLTLYTDSETHDDVTPISAPRRAIIRPGIFLSQFPGLPRLDLRVEAASSDPSTSASRQGEFQYVEVIQRQGYTNKGFIFGDWIGRESKGGQAWLTWHLSGNEYVQFSYRNAKAAKDFIAGGTTQNDFAGTLVKRFGPELELNANFQYEGWRAPLYKPGKQSDFSTAFQLTWYPHRPKSY